MKTKFKNIKIGKIFYWNLPLNSKNKLTKLTKSIAFLNTYDINIKFYPNEIVYVRKSSKLNQ